MASALFVTLGSWAVVLLFTAYLALTYRRLKQSAESVGSLSDALEACLRWSVGLLFVVGCPFGVVFSWVTSPEQPMPLDVQFVGERVGIFLLGALVFTAAVTGVMLRQAAYWFRRAQR